MRYQLTPMHPEHPQATCKLWRVILYDRIAYFSVSVALVSGAVVLVYPLAALYRMTQWTAVGLFVAAAVLVVRARYQLIQKRIKTWTYCRAFLFEGLGRKREASYTYVNSDGGVCAEQKLANPCLDLLKMGVHVVVCVVANPDNKFESFLPAVFTGDWDEGVRASRMAVLDDEQGSS